MCRSTFSGGKLFKIPHNHSSFSADNASKEGLLLNKKLRRKAFIKRIRNSIILILIGFVVGIIGLLGLQNHFLYTSSVVEGNTPDESISIVFSRIVDQNEMVSVSQDYSIVEKTGDTNRLFDIIEIPFSENSFWYRYVGTIKAGVNFEDASYSRKGDTICITLNEPYIISNSPNMDETGVLEENNNILNPIHVEDVDALQHDCVAKSQENAIAGGLLDEAKLNAENNIRNMFNAAFGDTYKVEFVWVSAAQN